MFSHLPARSLFFERRTRVFVDACRAGAHTVFVSQSTLAGRLGACALGVPLNNSRVGGIGKYRLKSFLRFASERQRRACELLFRVVDSGSVEFHDF